LYIDGRSPVQGSIDRVVVTEDGQAATELRDLDLAAPVSVTRQGRTQVTLQLTRAGTHARGRDGNALEGLDIVWEEPARAAPANAALKGRATLTVVKDFEPVHALVETMVRDTVAGKLDVFSNRPFRRASLLPVLFERAGMKPIAWCCVSESGMPGPVMEGHTSAANARAEADTKPIALQPFFRYCATCHQSSDRSPPNFLQGSANAVAANLAHCAQRLYVRLSMWQVPLEYRPKTPMPPPYALYAFHSSPRGWPHSAELGALKTYVENVLQAESGKAPRADELLSRGYENLRTCLPEAN
jgi:mono/diheme cytochrome c family protein